MSLDTRPSETYDALRSHELSATPSRYRAEPNRSIRHSSVHGAISVTATPSRQAGSSDPIMRAVLAFLKQPLAVEEHVLGGAGESSGDKVHTVPYWTANLQVFCR